MPVFSNYYSENKNQFTSDGFELVGILITYYYNKNKVLYYLGNEEKEKVLEKLYFVSDINNLVIIKRNDSAKEDKTKKNVEKIKETIIKN